MLSLELVVALLGAVTYPKGASFVFQWLRLYVLKPDIPGPCRPASECASTVASIS